MKVSLKAARALCSQLRFSISGKSRSAMRNPISANAGWWFDERYSPEGEVQCRRIDSCRGAGCAPTGGTDGRVYEPRSAATHHRARRNVVLEPKPERTLAQR